jgi:tetratricopeptide (TPR) repeat protein
VRHLTFLSLFFSNFAWAQPSISPELFLTQKSKDRQYLLAQQTRTDGLIKDSLSFLRWIAPLKKAAEAGSKTEVVVELACAEAKFWHYHKESVKARQTLKAAIELAEQHKLPMSEAEAKYGLGVINLRNLNYKEAVKYLLESHNQFQELGWDMVYDPREKLMNTGELMQQLYKNDLGLSYFTEAGKYIADSLSKDNFRLFLLLGWSYRMHKDFEKTQKCFQQCLKIGKAHNDKEMIASASGEIGADFFMQGRSLI